MLSVENSHSVHEVDAFKRPTACFWPPGHAQSAGRDQKRLQVWILGPAELSTAIAKSATKNLLKVCFS